MGYGKMNILYHHEILLCGENENYAVTKDHVCSNASSHGLINFPGLCLSSEVKKSIAKEGAPMKHILLLLVI
jgi:hypothetical protein